MAGLKQVAASSFYIHLRAVTVVLASLVLLATTVLATLAAQAQTYTVIHSFTGGADGALPDAGLTRDQAGNFYGTAGSSVFKLTKKGSGWVLTPLYDFQGGYDGKFAYSPVTIGPDGTLYGTTLSGGYMSGGDCSQGGCGVVYNVKPEAKAPVSARAPWTETVLHAFTGRPDDGNQPQYGTLIFDQARNLYGTTTFGGEGYGAVFELTPANGGWKETILYGGFYYGNGYPHSGVVMDAAGNLYGTTESLVYELSPTQYGWVLTVLHTFLGGKDDGDLAYGGLTFDPQGNLYGATLCGGSGNGGTVYELTPQGSSWTFTLLYGFDGICGAGPYDSLTLDPAGSLYGTTNGGGGNGAGMVFKLTQSDGAWTLTDLHDFSFNTEWFPYGGVTFDANGNLYGTASDGGAYGLGVVWEITP